MLYNAVIYLCSCGKHETSNLSSLHKNIMLSTNKLLCKKNIYSVTSYYTHILCSHCRQIWFHSGVSQSHWRSSFTIISLLCSNYDTKYYIWSDIMIRIINVFYAYVLMNLQFGSCWQVVLLHVRTQHTKSTLYQKNT